MHLCPSSCVQMLLHFMQKRSGPSGGVDWLEQCRLLDLCLHLVGTTCAPLVLYVPLNAFLTRIEQVCNLCVALPLNDVKPNRAPPRPLNTHLSRHFYSTKRMCCLILYRSWLPRMLIVLCKVKRPPLIHLGEIKLCTTSVQSLYSTLAARIAALKQQLFGLGC